MAIFKLGAIITGLVGSIGGTTFKRGKNNLIASKKSFGGSRNKLLQNNQLNPLASIFRAWSLLSSSQKEDWNNAALLFLFPDKFGVNKNLTGRQLYTKLNAQLLPTGAAINDPSGINSDLNEIVIDYASVDINVQVANIFFTEIPTGTTIMISVENRLAVDINPNFNLSKIIKSTTTSGETSVNFSAEYFSNYPFISTDYRAIIYVQVINEFGFKSVPYWVLAEIT